MIVENFELGVSRHTNLAHFIVLGAVDHCQCAITVTNHHTSARLIHTREYLALKEVIDGTRAY